MDMYLPDNYSELDLPGVTLVHHPSDNNVAPGIIIIELNRHHRNNLLTPDTCAALVQCFTLLSADTRVRAIVLTSADPFDTVFCLGCDPATRFPDTTDRNLHVDPVGAVALAIHNCTKPVVAAVNGRADGAGLSIILPCDARVACRNTRVGYSHARRGLAPDGCASFFLPRLVGAAKAMRLSLSGELLDPSHPVVEDLFLGEQCTTRCRRRSVEIADEMARGCSPVSRRLIRDLFLRAPPASADEAHRLESSLLFDLTAGSDFLDLVAARNTSRVPPPPRFRATVENDMPAAWPWWPTGRPVPGAEAATGTGMLRRADTELPTYEQSSAAGPYPVDGVGSASSSRPPNT